MLAGVGLSGHHNYGQSHSIDWFHDYQVIQCQGCETVSFREAYANSDDYYPSESDPNEYECDLKETVYPNPEFGRQPISDLQLLPQNLQSIYTETIRSINNDLAVLTGVGIRAVVETVCKDKAAQGDSLFKKIDSLVTDGVLTKDGAEILHKLRTLGNDAAHEVKPHDKVQLGLALDVIDHLLQGVYILPHHARATFK